MLDNIAALPNFRCRECGAAFVRWIGQCPRCDKYGTIIRTLATQATANAAIVDSAFPPNGGSHAEPRASVAATPVIRAVPDSAPDAHENAPTEHHGATAPIRITDVEDDDLERTPTGIEPLDRVLGGGLVPAGVYVLGGFPGAGKSTLLAQWIAATGLRALYVTGEETVEKATIRARRIDATHPEIWIAAGNDLDEALEHARRLAPAILAIDSIQVFACCDASGVAGSISQVKECTARLAAFANQHDTIVILIGHVTKDDELAGPNTLKHLVDVVLSLESPAGDGAEFQSTRILRCAGKNRFGATTEIGVFQMTSDGLTWDRDADPVLDEAIAP